jgi:SAM-dependent MidA family methyltransferase
LTALEALIRERIRVEGPLPFRAVMQAALYHPEHGYYTNLRGFGAEGDFITSPERHPAFGWLLGRQALDVWEALDRPRPFKILELGAGSGALAEPLVGFLRRHITPDGPPPTAPFTGFPAEGDQGGHGPRRAAWAQLPTPEQAGNDRGEPSTDVDELAHISAEQPCPPRGREHSERARDADAPDIIYSIDELSPTLRSVQRRRLTDPAFRWEGADEPAHFIIANEVADALPVHRVVARDGTLRELRVGLDEGGALSWVEHAAAEPEIEAYFAALHYLPPAGQVVDVCTDLGEWVKRLARQLERGVALVLDYAASPPRDSLLTYYRHTMGSDPLIRLGQQDISVHVDLRTLVRLAIAEGLRAGATGQRGLLFNLGFQQVQARLRGSTDRQALAGLVDPDGLGGQIAAVFLVRGLPGYKPVGAVGRNDWPEPAEIPSLPADQDEAEFLSQWREAFPK